MEEYTWKRFRWRMERRHARRSLLKFSSFLALCVVLDVWGPGHCLMALRGCSSCGCWRGVSAGAKRGLDGDADQLIYFDLLGRMKALPYSQIGSYTKKRSCVVIRTRTAGGSSRSGSSCAAPGAGGAAPGGMSAFEVGGITMTVIGITGPTGAGRPPS